MLKVNCKLVELNKFPDGTFLIKEKPSGDKAFISWKFESNEELVALIYITHHLRAHGVKTIHLFMPYIPNARQDRVKIDEDVFTLKYFALVVNSLKFDKVSVLDPHSSVSEALIEHIEIMSPAYFIDTAYNRVCKECSCEENDVLMFYPDEGAMKRYSGMISAPYAFGIKERDWATGKIKGLSVFEGENSVNGGFKKSQKGCCVVYRNNDNELCYKDEFVWDEAYSDLRNMLVPVFKDGVMTKEFTLDEVRVNLHGGNF